MDERIALAGENVNERVGLVFIVSRTVAVAVAIYDQTAVPIFGDVDAELGAVDLADFGLGLHFWSGDTQSRAECKGTDEFHLSQYISGRWVVIGDWWEELGDWKL